ncbi:chemotaxis protein CheC [Alteromonas australica]|jgi:chemotaxis protein CheC|uniref:Chemotaxis protein CheC n=1 Tax=Alteromonas australica TaxID=589873 RepID=A0A075NZG9_9ALTE|nr:MULTISPECIES: chemotaxis protein CheX [Alteromonas]MAB94313.1 chemotaxis protein CheC [Alteromonas sp.]AIG00040.1 chemotaxis protein CheC [Alteromonas australica]AJP45000.1 chemotaxis protein CheC [Alteromonas australica]MAO29186.1 chemotaxis protein CheC [Alteromonas sp.]MBU34954.1 chemotaxis protein CheC [Alteromonas sp.]|tara:strand:+ start:4752 stop:5336 length:585 start_codon:yes stop_codon:yes gene_type:complete
MSIVLPLDEEQRDALQELLNISMGQAANSLAQLIETKIDISIPKITSVTPTQLYTLLFETQNAFYTRQSFLGDVHGEVMSVLSQSGLNEVASLMEYDAPLSKEDIQEIILELSNILAGACLAGLSEQLELSTNLNMPTLFSPQKANFDELQWQHSLVMEVQFAIAISSFSMRVVFCLDDESLTRMKATLDELLA